MGRQDQANAQAKPSTSSGDVSGSCPLIPRASGVSVESPGDASSGSTGELAGDSEGKPPEPSASGVLSSCPPSKSTPTGDNQVLLTQVQTGETADTDKIASSRPAETGQDVRPITGAGRAGALSVQDL